MQVTLFEPSLLEQLTPHGSNGEDPCTDSAFFLAAATAFGLATAFGRHRAGAGHSSTRLCETTFFITLSHHGQTDCQFVLLLFAKGFLDIFCLFFQASEAIELLRKLHTL